MSKGFFGEITSRSSWARYGLRVADEDDRLKAYTQDICCRPLCTLTSLGTFVFLKSDSAIAQLFIHKDLGYLLCPELEALINSGDFVIEKNEKKLSYSDLEFHGSIVLHMNSEIKVYSGNILMPDHPRDNDFETVLLKENKPTNLPLNTFFLSSSAESVYIPEDYVGFVSDRNSNTPYIQMTYPALPFISHANAPYIGPKNIFQGNITFENVMVEQNPLFAGMKQSELYLRKLSRKSSYTKESRYNNQSGADKSKI